MRVIFRSNFGSNGEHSMRTEWVFRYCKTSKLSPYLKHGRIEIVGFRVCVSVLALAKDAKYLNFLLEMKNITGV